MASYLEKIIQSNYSLRPVSIDLLFILPSINLDHTSDSFGSSQGWDNQTFCCGYLLARSIPAVKLLFHRICPNINLNIILSTHSELSESPKGEITLKRACRLEEIKNFKTAQEKAMFYPLKNEFLDNYDIHNFYTPIYEENLTCGKDTVFYNAMNPGEALARAHHVKITVNAQNNGVIVIDNPEFNNAPFLQEHGFTDSKDLIRQYMPQYYPENIEGNDFKEAKKFFLKHKHVVLKPGLMANAQEVYIFNLDEAKNKKEKTAMIAKFEAAFNRIEGISGGSRIIIQKFAKGLFKYGETRIYCLNGKILPYGIRMFQSDKNKPFKPEHGADSEAVLLTAEELEPIKRLIDRIRHLNSYLLGVDLTRDIDAKGKERFIIFEANFISPGFFPRIAGHTETNRENVLAMRENLPETLQNYIETDPIESLVYKPIYRLLRRAETLACGLPQEAAVKFYQTYAENLAA